MGESENRNLVRGLAVWFWAEPASGEPGYLFEVGRVVQSGLGCGGFACGCILVSLFARSKQFFRFLLRVPLFMVSDTMYVASFSPSPRASCPLSIHGCSFVLRASCRARFAYRPHVRTAAPEGTSFAYAPMPPLHMTHLQHKAFAATYVRNG